MTSSNTPLVSIILGTYNGDLFLKEQVDSILQQTYPNIELVVVDDCSTDSTKAMLEQYAKTYPNVRVYFNDTNLGLIGNYEKATQLAQGEFIAFADQDDVWLPQKIEHLMAEIGNNMLIYCDSAYIDAKGILLGGKITDYRNPFNGRNLFMLDEDSGIWVAGHAALFRKEVLEAALPFSPYLNHDTWIVYAAMLKGSIKFTPDVLVLYRQHGNNLVGGLGCHNMMNKTNKVAEREDVLRAKIGRIDALCAHLSENETPFRSFLTKMRCYTLNPSFANRIRKLILRLRYANEIYEPRKRNILRKYIRVIKSF